MSDIPPYHPREYDDRYKRVYEAGADSFEENLPTEALEEYAKNVKQEGLQVLDLGCGEGRDSRFLSKKHQVAAIDISPNAIGNAHQRSKRMGVELDLIVADVSILPLRGDIARATVDRLKDGVEVKIVIGCTDEEIETIMNYHGTFTQKAILVRRNA